MKENKVRTAIVGLGFGAEFIPIHAKHPNIDLVTVCDHDTKRLDSVCEKFALKNRTDSFDELLSRDDIDAIHILSGIPDHAEQTARTLSSGKHCACTVPMATTISDIRRIIDATKTSGKNYMMMETSVYTRQFIKVREMYEAGTMGRLQFLKGAHYQDMERWPSYWMGLPPMHYATHAISPLLAIAKTRARKVHCFGSGTMREELVDKYNNPHPIETAIFELAGTDVKAEVSRSLFGVAKPYVESFWVLCEKMSFEWGRHEKEPPFIYTQENPGEKTKTEVFDAPDRGDLLPPEIGRFTVSTVYDETDPHLSFEQGGGHHGSHPHMVHEFVMSIIEKRKPWIDEITAAEWTAPGICAHESAIQDGAAVEVPDFVDANV